MKGLDMTKPTIAAAAIHLIAERGGPVPETELVDVAVQLGLTRARNPSASVGAALRSELSLVRLVDRRWLHLPTALAGGVFVHRLTPDEQVAGALRLDPDLTPIWSSLRWRTDRDVQPDEPAIAIHRFASASSDPDEIPPRARVLRGPEDWLRGRRAGDRVGARLVGAGPGDARLVLEDFPEPADEDASFIGLVGSAAHRRFSIHARDPYEPGIRVDEIVAEVLARDPAAFYRPRLPLGDALAAAGFETNGSLVAPPGTDWTGHDELWWEPFDTEPGDSYPIYELRIKLLELSPPIWRRVQVSAGISLERLHAVIQATMGWRREHLYEFTIGGVAYGPPDREFGSEIVDARRFRATRIGRASGATFEYNYDFGDGWRHEIVLERILEPEPGVRYPRLVGGERACPPENCGGPTGYLDFLAIVLDPRHPERRWMLDLVEGRFDPEVFDLDQAEHELAWV